MWIGINLRDYIFHVLTFRLKDEKMRKELEMENEKLVEELKRIQADQAKKKKLEETKKKVGFFLPSHLRLFNS